MRILADVTVWVGSREGTVQFADGISVHEMESSEKRPAVVTA
jgi:hypothetical protein